jgi:hypothetical protein
MNDFEVVELAIRRVVGRMDLKPEKITEMELCVRNALDALADELMKISCERNKVYKDGGWNGTSGD